MFLKLTQNSRSLTFFVVTLIGMKFLSILLCLCLFRAASDAVFWRDVVVSNVIRGKHFRMSPWLKENLEAGGQLAMTHCQQQFQWDRWNCPREEFRRWNEKAPGRLTKQFGYLDAIVSAAVVHTISRNCSSGYYCPGLHYKQTADHETRTLMSNGHISYGEYIVQSYLENPTSGSDPTSVVVGHNMALGRKMIKNLSEKHCMCHGISGTCTLKTCWMQPPPFSKVAQKLKEKYNAALRLDFEGANGMKIGNSASSSGLKSRCKAQNRIIYLEESPNYCKPNASLGWPGMRGRICSDSDQPTSKKHCRHLCKKCGYNVVRVRKSKKICNCKFTWCCKVTCETCYQTFYEYYCA